MWMASLICLPLYFVFRCRSRFYIRLFNVNVSRRDNWSLRLFTIIRSLVGEAGRTRNSLAHWEKKWEGGFRRGWGYPRRFIVNISRHSIIIVVSGYCIFSFFVRAFCRRLCKVTGRRHRVSPCRSAYFASPWRLLTLNLRRRGREAALIFPESWWHLTMWALARLVSW